ncbi:hypothetical protein A0J61_09477 [Choanephora cucurbitarum]|uniref:Amino acid transporter transmembrane domain-containing protein n=1 Tax=Choanephora cucurbitarum TaxID=101091 RepID=A0A1C7N567_9FUNG|nr:hypothetical protein A0J61_09477 [Choanephora cucurbitarum]
MSDIKGIGSFGSTALLVSSLTGPGLSTIPALYQSAGWIIPVIIFIIIAFLSGCSALFVCEALSNIRGNERFQAKVELTTIAQVYLGKKYHYFFQVMLFLALQAVNIASIIISTQTFDSMIIAIFKGTCGAALYPGGWVCVGGENGIDGNSPFPTTSFFLFTFGFLLSAILIIPLGFFSLVENIAFQMISFTVLTVVLIVWIVGFGQSGLDPSLLPATGSNASMVLGIAIFNYSFITTIPSWVNSLRPDVNIHRCLWVSVVISTIFYVLLGIFGAMAYEMDASSDILAILSAHGSIASKVMAYLFPVCALVTSIPVFTIVIRSNLLRGEICSKHWAIFWSNLFPWIVCIPLQSTDYVNQIQNWSSLFFQSTCNFVLPFILYFVSRKYVASVEPTESLKQPTLTEKQMMMQDQVPAPSPILLQNPDNNDVRMFNPDDNCSISIRRSSIHHSRFSQMEQSVIAYSPAIDKVPAIVYNSNVDQSPVIPKQPSSPLPHYHGPPNGLGISDPSLVHESHLMVPSATLSAPGSPDVSNSKNQPPPFMSPKSPEITQAPPSPVRGSISHHSSMLASVFSFKSPSMVAPLEQEKQEETKSDEYEMTPEERQHELQRFVAFKPKRWLNPFYLAIVSCAILSLSLLFMIIYSLALLGMGVNIYED